MAATNNINRISSIYRQWQPFNNSGAPHAGNIRPASVMPVDRVTLSGQAFKEDSKNPDAAPGLHGEQELDTETKEQINDLKKRDSEVKAHESAHMASGGNIVQGGATYEYQTGPDGKMYAIGGEVKIDVSPERTPEATIRKMQQVRRAALAPAQPSGTDRAVAAQATQVEAQARIERARKGPEGHDDKDQTDDSASVFTPAASAPTPYQFNREARGGHIDLSI